MRLHRALPAVAVALAVASFVMFAASFGGSDRLAPPINTIQLLLVLMALFSSILLFFRMDKGTFVRPIWGLISLALTIDVAAKVCELINGFAREWRISADAVFTIYIFVWLAVAAIPIMIYVLFKRSGFEFEGRAYYFVIPPLAVITAVTVVIVIVPLFRSDASPGMKISDLLSVVIPLAILYFVLFVAVTIGRGELGRPWLYISIAVTCFVVQTIVTTHILVVAGHTKVLEPANFVMQLGYVFLIFATSKYMAILS